jgi:CheY-like chemotaxis protein
LFSESSPDPTTESKGGGRDAGINDHPLVQVLLIDDNRDDNLYHTLVLKALDPATEVISVSSCNEALEFLANLVDSTEPPPDLVLVDLNMPAMTGWEFIEAYGRRGAGLNLQTQLIVLSTTENPDEIRRVELDPRIAGFLSKPLDEATLEGLLATYF